VETATAQNREAFWRFQFHAHLAAGLVVLNPNSEIEWPQKNAKDPKRIGFEDFPSRHFCGLRFHYSSVWLCVLCVLSRPLRFWGLTRKPKLALANSSGTGILPVELRLRPHGGFFPAPRGKRPARCRSHYRRQFPFRSSSLTAIFQPPLANKRDGALGSSPHRPAAVFAR
jgi:hypothetical protein